MGIPSSISTIAGLARYRLESTPIELLVRGEHTQTQTGLQSIARRVAALDPDPTRPVAVLLQQDADGWLLVLAAVASGRPALFLDAFAEKELLAHRIKAVNPCALLAAQSLEEMASSFGLDLVELTGPDVDTPLLEPPVGAPSIICFTSGSTGEPKSFARTQGGMFLLGCRRMNARNLPDGYCHMSCMSPMFTGFMNNFGQVLAGAATCVPLSLRTTTPEQLYDSIRRNNVNFVPLVPTLLRQILHLAQGSTFPENLKIINLSGELMTRSDLRGWLEELPTTTTIQISYGSTESGTLTVLSIDEAALEGDGPIELGHPLPGVELQVADSELRPCPQGTVGWIHARSLHEVIPIGSVSPEHIHVEIEGEGPNWLPMGDRGFINERGSLVLLGRFDGEIKVNGQRFDPAACEGATRALEEVSDAVVIVVEHESTNIPVVFAIAEPEAYEAIRTLLMGVTTVGDLVRIEIRSSLPTTSTGKVDRLSLKEEALMLLEAPISSSRTDPRNRTERIIQDVWSNHLKLKLPPLDRAFRELGGTSLGFLRVMIDLKEHFGIELPAEQLQELNTIELQAEAAGVASDSDHMSTPLIEFSAGEPGGAALMILPGIGGHVWAFKPLAESLATNSAIAGVDWSSTRDFADLTNQVLEWCAGRPLVVVGFSGGSRVAGELTSRLEAAGHPPSRLVILDGSVQTPPFRGLRLMLQRLVPRPKSSHEPVDAYLKLARKRGRAFQQKIRFKQLRTPVRLLLSRNASDSLRTQWTDVAPTQTIRTEAEHLELVRYPIPSEVSSAILDS